MAGCDVEVIEIVGIAELPGIADLVDGRRDRPG
jgi:hypothetical protein